MNFVVKNLGLSCYKTVWKGMQDFTSSRDNNAVDEIWFAEHNSVYTQGLAGKDEHIIQSNSIPIVRSDRGGQVTYHGPGQLLVYVMLDLRRKSYCVKSLVWGLEQVIIDYLDYFNIIGCRQDNAPGVYVDNRKIASVGLRVSRGCSLHGIAFNVDMDLAQFLSINPCGYKNLEMCNLSDYVSDISFIQVSEELVVYLNNRL